MRGQRFKTKHEAEDSYEHYLEMGGDKVHSDRLPPERIRRGYIVSKSGHVRRRDPAADRARLIEAGKRSRFGR